MENGGDLLGGLQRRGVGDRLGQYQEVRQSTAGKICMAKNNLAKE